MKDITFPNSLPLFQSRNISELQTALADDDDGPDGSTFNRKTSLKRTPEPTTPSYPN